MNIWLLHVGEELPVDENPRLFRYGYLAEELARRGHQILRWAPTFQHARKVQRFDRHQLVEVSQRYRIQFVRARGYSKNISLARFQSYRELARQFACLASGHRVPDLILAGIPTPGWCEAAIRFAQPRQIPLVVDVRDLWPDIFGIALPHAIRPVARRVFDPLYRQTARVCRQATGLTGVSQSYLDWGLANAGRQITSFDRVFPLGYSESHLDDATLREKREWLVAQGVEPQKTLCTFFGLFEKSYDLRSVLNAAHLLQEEGRQDIQFVLCGSGSKLPQLQREAANLGNVRLLGWVDKATIAALMKMSEIGLASYESDALQSLPNKPFEYMAGRLAVASSLPGELATQLDHHGCGVTYQAGNAAALAKVVGQLAGNPTLLGSMRQNAYEAFAKHYRVEAISSAMVDYLEFVKESAGSQVSRAA